MTDAGPPDERAVPRELAGQSLDRVLAGLWPDQTRSAWQKRVRRGEVRLDGKVVNRSNLRIQKGQRVSVGGAVAEAGQVAPLPDPTVLFEDEHVLALDKPPGWLTHAADRAAGPTIVSFAAKLGPLADAEDPDRPGVVHRLDRGTSGVILLARTPLALERLRDAFRARRTDKRYTALVHGEPAVDEFEVDLPLRGGASGADRQLAGRHAKAKEARTRVWVLERLGAASLVECKPETGRRHQIRVHLQEAGFPVVNDPLYRAPAELRPTVPRLPRGRHALHAASLTLRHPAGGRELSVRAPLPEDLLGALEVLRGR
ncbi:RluA family pseudouridine synthase [Engelhardtia mirabilis]|uniref:Pseudouridine synthase n=1 Tax=Engelhardtia mirabilis TaxID=2528011 RepID=A0A518BMV9_9BACT|nr:Ribosomal large subunit pseudouridine synthase D [Planctomycetes bacterium Pla133]QDV02602.1 Ribosomal large subunit pseudouridine synthase D [Planctomycetes bacterium Pla86]